MKNEFLVTLLTSSGEKQCLQRFKNVVMSFNRVLRDFDTVVRTQCWNLRGPCAKNNADDVRASLDNSDLVICVVDPTSTEGVREDVVQALDWVRESFQMAFFAVKERNMFIYVKESSGNSAGRKQAQRAVSFLETLYKKDYNPITYPSENAFALTLLYQLCNMVRAELWCNEFPKEKGWDLGDIFTPEGIENFGISFRNLPWVKNCKEYIGLCQEIDALRLDLTTDRNRYSVAKLLTLKDDVKKKREREMLLSYYLLCRFFCRKNTPEMEQTISAFLSGDLSGANKKLNITQLVRHVSAYRKNPTALKNAGGTYKMEFAYLLNCYLLKIHLLFWEAPLILTDAQEKLYNDVLSLSQGLVTLVEQMGINDEAGGFFYMRSEISRAKAQFDSSVKMFEAFPREKKKKTSILGIMAYNNTALCLEEELGDVKIVQGQYLPRKTFSSLKAIGRLYQKSLTAVLPLLKRYPQSYWPVFAYVYVHVYNFYIRTGQIERADKLSEEMHLMVSKLVSPLQNEPEYSTEVKQDKIPGNKVAQLEEHKVVQIGETEGEQEEVNKEDLNGSSKRRINECDFSKLLNMIECKVYLWNNRPERAQQRIPKDIQLYLKANSQEPDKVEKDLFAWKDSEEALPDIFAILKWKSPEDAQANKKDEKNQKEAVNGDELNAKNNGSITLGLQSHKGNESNSEEDTDFDPEGFVNWDIAKILLDQANVYKIQQDWIKSIKFAAAAIESINRRLVKNPALVSLLEDAIKILQDGYFQTNNITAWYEVCLQMFNLQLADFKLNLAQGDRGIKWAVFELAGRLKDLPENEYGLLSEDILADLRDLAFENFLTTEPEAVDTLLKTLGNFFKKIWSTEQIEKNEELHHRVQEILQSQNNEIPQNEGLFWI